MSLDIRKKRIILIHGLASKPPEKDWFGLWKKCLIENIRCDDKALARQLEKSPDVFMPAYWANTTPYHLEDDRQYVRKLRLQVEKVIEERRRTKDDFHVGLGEKVGAFFKDRGEDVVKLIAGALSVKDDVMKQFLRETMLYDEDQYIADRMRKELEDALRVAWNDGCEVAIISHSMGTFISYDVLWRFSHRNVGGFKEFKNKRVELFVTMGSPLGDSAVRGLLFARRHKKRGKRRYPTNIEMWHNYACMGDVVSHGGDFNDVFFGPLKKLGILKPRPKHRLINYTNLHNPFEVVSHSGNRKRARRDPHKSYGYLVQPRLGTWLADYLRGQIRHY